MPEPPGTRPSPNRCSVSLRVEAAVTVRVVEEQRRLESDPTAGNLQGAATAVERERCKFTLLQAIGFNTMNMFGTGPFITIPYCLASISPQGPHAMVGYTLACVACMCDSLVWAELGAMWPEDGGPYVYLRELYGRETLGRLASFMYVWQFFVSCPCEVASGFIAVAEYLVYFHPSVLQYGRRIAISLACLSISGIVLFRGIKDIGRVALFLWGVTILAIIFTLIAGFTDFHFDYLMPPPNAFGGSFRDVMRTISAATAFGVYDMAGYYDVCYMGGSIMDGRRNVPRSCILTCCSVAIIFVLVYIAVLGHLDWRTFIDDYNKDSSISPSGIMSRFAVSRLGPWSGGIMTVVVAITIFGSTLAVLCGQAHVPYAAAKDRIFFRIFSKESDGVPAAALLAIICLSGVWCFFSLDLVIKGLVTIVVFVQFMGQSVGLLYYRWRVPLSKQPKGFRMPLYPLPVLVQLTIFFFIWITTDSWFLWGSEEPVLELSIGFLLLGPPLFLLHAKYNQTWPFGGAPDADAADPESIGKATVVEELEREDSQQILMGKAAPDSPIVSLDDNCAELWKQIAKQANKLDPAPLDPSDVSAVETGTPVKAPLEDLPPLEATEAEMVVQLDSPALEANFAPEALANSGARASE